MSWWEAWGDVVTVQEHELDEFGVGHCGIASGRTHFLLVLGCRFVVKVRDDAHQSVNAGVGVDNTEGEIVGMSRVRTKYLETNLKRVCARPGPNRTGNVCRNAWGVPQELRTRTRYQIRVGKDDTIQYRTANSESRGITRHSNRTTILYLFITMYTGNKAFL